MTIDSKALEEKLKSLQGDAQKKIVAAALREGAKVYQAAVAEAAPERTDDLPDTSTALPPGELKSDVIISRGRNNVSDTTVEYDVSFGKETAHVARFVDEGHRLVEGGRSKVNAKTGKTSGPGKQVGSVAPHPFFRSAFETASQEATAAIEASLNAGIEKAFNK